MDEIFKQLKIDEQSRSKKEKDENL